jgi:radical SAM protein with 4Fe4S-binding SPASM domain
LEIELIEKILQSPLAPRIKNWFISGGEPLCYPHLEEALKLFQRHGHRPKLATNGILLTTEIIDRWVSLGVQSIQFSFDTLKPSVFKKLSAGSSKNHRSILENMKSAVASPLRLITSSVLTKANVREIEDVMRLGYESGVDSYTLYPDVPARKSNGDLVVPIADQTELVDHLFGVYYDLCRVRLIDLSIPCFQYSNVYARWKDRLNIRLHSCGAGQFNLKITSEGKVSVCICQDAAEFIVGDLRQRTIDEIWNSPEIEKFRSLYKDIPECRSCQVQSLCRGGCRNEAYVSGSQGILSSDPHCEYLKINEPRRF